MNKTSAIPIAPALRRLFDQMPGCWGCKDKNSVFIYANKEFSKIIGFKENNLDIIGRTDFDMPCAAVNCAKLFRKQDTEVMLTKREMRVLDVHQYSGGEWRAYVFTKVPLYAEDGDNVIGTIFQGVDITKSFVDEIGVLLLKIKGSAMDIVAKDGSYILGKGDKPMLTDREAECLFFMLRGNTAKQIAKILHISYRTIEEYLNNMKIKFNVQNKFELTNQAILAGFLNIIPKSLFCKQLSVILREN